MKVVELVKISSEALKMMSENDVMRDDWRFVPMYEEFQAMRKNGLKYRECIRLLSEDYHVSRATDVLCDPDGYDGIVFCRYLADCSAKGCVIFWDRML